jgi:predicted hydrocarbon binding protein
MKSKVSGQKIVIFPVTLWTELRRQFERAYGKGADAIVEHMAEEYGRSVGRGVISQGKSVEELLSLFQQLTAESGWGELKIEGDKGRGEAFRLELSSCAFCEEGMGAERCRCDVVRWTAAGVAQEVYKRGYTSWETGCVGRGGVVCSFELRASEKKGGDSWKARAYFPWLSTE